MNMIFINNTSDIKALRNAVRLLEDALDKERKLSEQFEQQRDDQILEATVYANMARTLAKELGFTLPDLKELKQECQKLCTEDLKKRGLKHFAEHPPKFTVCNWRGGQRP